MFQNDLKSLVERDEAMKRKNLIAMATGCLLFTSHRSRTFIPNPQILKKKKGIIKYLLQVVN